MSVHQLHLSPHSSRIQYFVEQSCFPLLGSKFFLPTHFGYILVLHQHPTYMVWGRPIFPSLPMSSLEMLHSYHNHYLFIFHLILWDQIQLGSSYHRNDCQFKLNVLPSWHITNAPNCLHRPTLSIGKPQLLCEIHKHEGVRYLFINPWDISTIHLSLKAQMIWPWLKATSLGHKATV